MICSGPGQGARQQAGVTLRSPERGRVLGEAMIRVLCVLTAAVLAAMAAGAQSDPQPAAQANPAAAMPEPIEAALATAESRIEPGQRWAFTRTYVEDGDAQTERYDPRREPGTEWFVPSQRPGDGDGDRILVQGNADRRPCDMPPDDLALMPGDFAGVRAFIGSDVRLLGGGAGVRRYAFQPPDIPYPGMFSCRRTDLGPLYRNLKGEIILTEGEAGFTVRLYAPESFRFRGLRFLAHEETRRYGEAAPGGPILLLGMEQHIEYRALFFSPSGARSVTYRDFERVAVETASVNTPAGDPAPTAP